MTKNIYRSGLVLVYTLARHCRKSATFCEASTTINTFFVQSSKPLLPLTREDIRQWFCTSEIPYSTFRSPNGQIYPWFHGKDYFTIKLIQYFPLRNYKSIVYRTNFRIKTSWYLFNTYKRENIWLCIILSCVRSLSSFTY